MLSVTGLDSAEIAETAFSNGVVLHELTPVQVSLEDAYLALTRDHVEYDAISTDPAQRRTAYMSTAGADPVTGTNGSRSQEGRPAGIRVTPDGYWPRSGSSCAASDHRCGR